MEKSGLSSHGRNPPVLPSRDRPEKVSERLCCSRTYDSRATSLRFDPDGLNYELRLRLRMIEGSAKHEEPSGSFRVTWQRELVWLFFWQPKVHCSTFADTRLDRYVAAVAL